MATAKTWLWIILGFVGVCVLGLSVIAGTGVYFVSKHIQIRATTLSPFTRESANAEIAAVMLQSAVFHINNWRPGFPITPGPAVNVR